MLGGALSLSPGNSLVSSWCDHVTHCRDLGVTVVSDLSSTQYISEIVSKAHQRANCIVRSFSSGDIHLLVRAFIVYVRPIVE